MKNNLLKNLKIASPCSADWAEMLGNQRQRYCGQCRLTVYNISEMSEQEAQSILQNAERMNSRLCVRFYRRADGTILAQDCPVGWRALKQRLSHIATAAASLIFGVVGGFLVGGGAPSSIIAPKNNDLSLEKKLDKFSDYGEVIVDGALCFYSRNMLKWRRMNLLKMRLKDRRGKHKSGGITNRAIDVKRKNLTRQKR